MRKSVKAADLVPGQLVDFSTGPERVTQVTRTLGQLLVVTDTDRRNLDPREVFEVIR